MEADDYVTKPFKLKPLIHRIRALLRRPRGKELPGDIVSRNGIEIDRLNHQVRINGEELLLTPTEFRLLWTLIRQPGRTFSRNELMDSSRGEDANALERTIDVHIRSLRLKLVDRASLVETVRGIGYRFREEAEHPREIRSRLVQIALSCRGRVTHPDARYSGLCHCRQAEIVSQVALAETSASPVGVEPPLRIPAKSVNLKSVFIDGTERSTKMTERTGRD